MAMVMPRSRSSGALSIESKARYSAEPFRARYLEIAAVRLVLPWSMWPIVPMLTWGLLRSNFFLAMSCSLDLGLLDEFRGQARWHFGVVAELHRGRRASLGHAAQVRHVPEHLGKRDEGADDLGLVTYRAATALHPLDLAAPAGEVADQVAHYLLRHRHYDPHARYKECRVCHGDD